MLSTEQTQRSLWLGDLPQWIDEAFLLGIFAGTNQLISVKLIRNRATGASEGYAFLEFRAHEAADTILKTYNGHPIPNTDLVFRLNWAAYGVGKAQPAGEGKPSAANIVPRKYHLSCFYSLCNCRACRLFALCGRFGTRCV